MKASLRSKKDSLLSEATYLFIFTFGNVGSKAAIFWLPALQREDKQHSESFSYKTSIIYLHRPYQAALWLRDLGP